MDKREHYCTVGGNVNCYSHYGRWQGNLNIGFFGVFLAWLISFFSIQIILEQKLEFLQFYWSNEETYPDSNHSEFDSNDNYVRLDQVN